MTDLDPDDDDGGTLRHSFNSFCEYKPSVCPEYGPLESKLPRVDAFVVPALLEPVHSFSSSFQFSRFSQFRSRSWMFLGFCLFCGSFLCPQLRNEKLSTKISLNVSCVSPNCRGHEKAIQTSVLSKIYQFLLFSATIW